MGGRIYRPEQGAAILELPEIGRLHIGMKNDRGLPQSIDWFRPTGKYAGLFTQALGEKPQTITVIFPDDDPTKVCNERYEYRDNAGALVARGDGRTFEIWNGKVYAPYSIDQYPDIMDQITARNPKKLRNENDNGWDVALTLRFIIPELLNYRIFGVWGFTTKGVASSVQNIRNSFDSVQRLCGTVTQTAFDLSVQFSKSNKPGVNSRYPVVSLIGNNTRAEEIRNAISSIQNASM